MRWQMALYKEMAGKAEDADIPEKVVKRVQEVSAVLYHIEMVCQSAFLSNTFIFSIKISSFFNRRVGQTQLCCLTNTF